MEGSVRAEQGKGEMGGGGTASGKHWMEKGETDTGLLNKWQGPEDTGAEDRSTRALIRCLSALGGGGGGFACLQ